MASFVRPEMFSVFMSSREGANSRREEVFLVKFFDEEYVDYRKTVGTWIPFIQ